MVQRMLWLSKLEDRTDVIIYVVNGVQAYVLVEKCNLEVLDRINYATTTCCYAVFSGKSL